MTIDVYTATGTKKGSLDLPATLFADRVNKGLIHQALMLQQGNARGSIAHAKRRSEVRGSTRKLFQQKGTGRARRGSVRSPLLRGGGKSFGPRSDSNFMRDMPKKMRHAALRACLSLQAKSGAIMGLESYPNAIKTKDFATLLGKLPVDIGRRILVVMPEMNKGLMLSARNVPGVRTVVASYLNPEDVLVSKYIIFLVDAIAKVEQTFGKNTDAVVEGNAKTTEDAAEIKTPKKTTKKTTTKKTTKAPKKPASKKAS